MLAALACIPADVLKRVLELSGYTVVKESTRSWALTKSTEEEPIIIPRKGDVVTLEVMMSTLIAAQIQLGDYFALRDKAMAEMQKKVN